MTYDQLLPVYRQLTGLPGQDDAFNHWVQGIIDTSGSRTGTEGIPDNFFQTSQGQNYLSKTAPAGSTGNVGAAANAAGVPSTAGGYVQPNVSAPVPTLGNTLSGILNPTNDPNYANAFGAADSALNAGASRAQAGGNTNQVQGGQQAGQYITNQQQANVQDMTGTQSMTGSQNTTGQQSMVGSQSTTGQQNTTGFQNTTGQQNTTGSQSMSGAQASTGSQTGSQSSQQATTGTSTSAVDASKYGLGGLLNNLTAQAGPADAARTQFLTQTMQNGDPALQMQVDRAVRQATSGPSMVHAGQSANDRAAAYAAQAVGMNSLQGQLQAAQQLAGPNASTTALQAAQPFAGTTTTQNQNSVGSALNSLFSNNQQTNNQNVSSAQQQNTNQNVGTSQSTSSNQNVGTSQNTSSNQNVGTSQNTSTGQHTMGAQGSSTAGNATGASTSISTGQVPQQSQSGGCFVCTAYVAANEMKPGVLRRAVRWKLKHLGTYERSLRGYSYYGPRLARLVLTSPLFARLFKPTARAVLYEEYRLATHRVRFKVFPWLAHFVFNHGSKLFSPWGAFGNYDGLTMSLLRSQNLYFTWRS